MVAEVPLRHGLVALVDDEDAELIRSRTWYIAESRYTYYAYWTVEYLPGKKIKTEYMHTLITGFKLTDHINGNGLDNRRSNLRQASQSENLRNQRKRPGTSSQFKGVTWDKSRRQWSVAAHVDGRRIALGRFMDEHAAALAYDAAVRELFGEFAAVNFPRPGERGALLQVAKVPRQLTPRQRQDAAADAAADAAWKRQQDGQGDQ